MNTEQKHSIIIASFGNKTKYEFDNTTKRYTFSKRQIDGCVIKNDTACDWLFEIDKKQC